jgi:hypothetical protein
LPLSKSLAGGKQHQQHNKQAEGIHV